MGFKLIRDPLVSNYTSTFNCTSTITMKNSSAIDVSINIKLMDDSAVCIGLIQSTEKHYENSLIYGILHLICVEKSEYCK
jgi:hypothetical protein